MPQELVFVDGRFLDSDELRLSLLAPALVYGTTLTERLRTFQGSLFRVEAHRRRLAHSLEAVGMDQEIASAELFEAAQHLADENRHASGVEEIGVVVLVFPPEADEPHAPPTPQQPRVVVHTSPLPMSRWAPAYERGLHVVTSHVRHVPEACWPRHLKCRSRMHYYLAQRDAAERAPGCVPLLLDHDGQVTETPTANVVVYRRADGLLAPPPQRVLPGVSLAVLEELAAQEGIAWRNGPLWPEQLQSADEVFLTSTSSCVLPVTRFDGAPVGDGRVGEVYGRLLAAWCRLVGVDIAAQAQRLAGGGSAHRAAGS